MSLSQDVGIRLKIARICSGYRTAKEFYEKCSIPKTTYHQHERGIASLSLDQLINYANLFEIDPAWLLTGRGHPCPWAKNAEEKKNQIKTLLIQHQQAGELSVTQYENITSADDTILINFKLFSSILCCAFKKISKLNTISEQEILDFCIAVYNNIHAMSDITQDNIDKMIELCMDSMLQGNAIASKITT